MYSFTIHLLCMIHMHTHTQKRVDQYLTIGSPQKREGPEMSYLLISTILVLQS